MKLLSIYNFAFEEAGKKPWRIDAWELETGQRYRIESGKLPVLQALYPLICQQITAPAGSRVFFHQRFFSQYDRVWLDRTFRTSKTLKLWLNLDKEPYLAWLKINKLELLRLFGLYSYQFQQPHQLPTELLPSFALVSILCQETGLVCVESCQQIAWPKEQLFFWQAFIEKSPVSVLLQAGEPNESSPDDSQAKQGENSAFPSPVLNASGEDDQRLSRPEPTQGFDPQESSNQGDLKSQSAQGSQHPATNERDLDRTARHHDQPAHARGSDWFDFSNQDNPVLDSVRDAHPDSKPSTIAGRKQNQRGDFETPSKRSGVDQILLKTAVSQQQTAQTEPTKSCPIWQALSLTT